MKRFAIFSIMLLSLVFSAVGGSIFADEPATNKKAPPSLSGKVIETMDSGRYTYVCLERNKEKIWVAVYKMKVVVGQNLSLKPGIEMVNFESKTLKRKFDRIFFSEGPMRGKK